MPNIPVLNIGGIDYNVKDAEARNHLVSTVFTSINICDRNRFTKKYISGNGVVQNGSDIHALSDYVDVHDIDQFMIASLEKPDAWTVSLYNSSKRFLSRITYEFGNESYCHIIDKPNNVYYVRICIIAKNGTVMLDHLDDWAVSLFANNRYTYSDINAMMELLSSKITFSWTSGLVSSSGSILQNPNNYYSQIISKDYVNNFLAFAKSEGYQVAYAVYDDNGNFVERIEWSDKLIITDANIRVLLYTPIEDESIDNVLTKIGMLNVSNISSPASHSNTQIDRACHISFDDYTGWALFIENENTYSSIFDDPFINYLHGLHLLSGAVFTLNCLCKSGTYSIEDCPNKFASQFSANRDWLKFAFHGEDGNTTYETDKVSQITGSYDNFVTGIYALTGDLRCIDRVTRTQSFTGTVNNIVGIRDCDCGIIGLFTAQDIRSDYYLTQDEDAYAFKHVLMYDPDHYITFIKSQYDIGAGLQDTVPSDVLAVANGNISPFFELYLHYTVWQTSQASMTAWLNFLSNNGYTFVYPMYHFRLV